MRKVPGSPRNRGGWVSAQLQQLGERARRLAATIQANARPGEVPLTAVFGYRSHTAYAAVLGALMAGHGYVPLNRTFPIDRTRLMFEKSTCRSLVVDKESESQLSELLRGLATPMVILCPDRVDATEASAKLPGHSVVGANELVDADAMAPAASFTKRNRLPTFHFRQHRSTQRGDGFPRERAPLRGLRYKAVRFH